MATPAATLFTDDLPGEQRKFLRAFLSWLRENGITRLHIPNVGQFSVAKVALEAGFLASELVCYDLNLFGSLLGTFYAGASLDTLGFKIVQPALRESYESAQTEAQRLAAILYAMKVQQLRPYVATDRVFRDELLSTPAVYIGQLEQQLLAYYEVYKGVTFKQEDLRRLVADKALLATDGVVVHLPKSGELYERNFSLGGLMSYQVLAPSFNYRVEVGTLWHDAERSKAAQVWHLPKVHEDVPEDCLVYAKQAGPETFGYFAYNRPDTLQSFANRYTVQLSRVGILEPPKYLLVSPKELLDERDSIFIKEITSGSASYYREQFSQSGYVGRGLCYGLFLNGQLLAVSAFTSDELRKLQGTSLTLQFLSVTPMERYPTIQRLALACFLSEDFLRYALATSLASLPYIELNSLRTTVQASDRDSVTHADLMEVVERENLDNGQFRLTYETGFTRQTYKQVLSDYVAAF